VRCRRQRLACSRRAQVPVTAAAAAEAARCGRAADFDTDTEDIPGGYSANHDEEQKLDEERHPMEDSDSDEPTPPAPPAPPAQVAAPPPARPRRPPAPPPAAAAALPALPAPPAPPAATAVAPPAPPAPVLNVFVKPFLSSDYHFRRCYFVRFRFVLRTTASAVRCACDGWRIEHRIRPVQFFNQEKLF
jgi:hypothetical protein